MTEQYVTAMALNDTIHRTQYYDYNAEVTVT